MAKRRRGHGEGTIVQRSDGQWMGQIDLGYIDGKRKRKTLYGKTRREVAEKLKLLLAQHGQGYNIAPERQTVAQFLTRWLHDVVQPSTRPRTYRVYAQHVHGHVLPSIGHIPLAKLTAQHVQNMLNTERKAGLSPMWVERTRDVLRNALNQAVKWDLVSRNVATLVHPPKVEQRTPHILTRAEVQQLLAAAQGDRLEALYRVALSLGLRQGEILGLRWQDVDLEAGLLRVEVALQNIGGKLVLVKPKTTKSQRTLPLPPSLIPALRHHKVRQLEERMLAGSRWQEHDGVFTTSVGTPISPRNLYRSFQALLARAGLPHMRFHDLRHSCATLLAVQGVPPRVAMDILGHSNIHTTMQVYTHVLDDSKRDALTAIDWLFGEAQTG